MWDAAACARIGSDLRGVRDWRRTPCPRERRIVVLCANRVRAAGATVAPVRIGQYGTDCPMSRGAAEGLEGPAGTERLDPTQTGHPDFPEAAAEHRGLL